MATIIPDSPALTVPSVRSESDWQSLHEGQQSRQPPSLILDSNCRFLTQCSTEELRSQIVQLRNLPLPIYGLDTTPDLPNKEPGGLERSLGDARACDVGGFCIGTKVKMMGSALGPGKGELKAGLVRESLRGSLKRMKTRKVKWIIAQRQDADVSLGEAVGGFQGLVGEGWTEMWGVKDYQMRPLRDILKVCERRRYHKPRIYQGEYNFLSRKSEGMMHLLQAHEIAFHAYDPTAKGFLLHKSQTSGPEAEDLRGQSSAWKGKFDSNETQQAVKRIVEMGEAHGVSLQSSALRWLAYHSKLGQQDCIILSASSYADLEEKVGEIAKGPLPEEMVQLLNEVGKTLWDTKSRGP